MLLYVVNKFEERDPIRASNNKKYNNKYTCDLIYRIQRKCARTHADQMNVRAENPQHGDWYLGVRHSEWLDRWLCRWLHILHLAAFVYFADVFARPLLNCFWFMGRWASANSLRKKKQTVANCRKSRRMFLRHCSCSMTNKIVRVWFDTNNLFWFKRPKCVSIFCFARFQTLQSVQKHQSNCVRVPVFACVDDPSIQMSADLLHSIKANRK